MLRILFISFLTIASATADDLKLEETLRTARNHAAADDGGVELAQARIRALEAMGRRRLDLNPRLGILSLINPVAFAADVSLGTLSRQNAASPVTMLDARIDLLSAEIGQRRQWFQREAEVTRRFYEVAAGQDGSAHSCEAARESEADREVWARKLRAGQINQLAVLQHEQVVLDRQAACRQASMNLELATMHLAVLTGLPAASLHVVNDAAAPPSVDVPLQSTETLILVALRHRAEPSTIRDKITALRRQIETARENHGLQLSLALAKDNSLSAGKHLLQVKLRQVERDAERLEEDIRTQVVEMRIRYQARRDEIVAAERRVQLANDYYAAVAQRERAGLESATQLAAAESAGRSASTNLARLESANRTDFAVLISICGLPRPAGRSRSAPAGEQDHGTVNFMRTNVRRSSLVRTSLWLSALLIAAGIFSAPRMRKSVYEAWKPYVEGSHDTVLAAKIEPAVRLNLVTEYTANVRQVLVSRGARVAQGDLLVILENGEIASQVTLAERRVQIAMARLLEARSKRSVARSQRLGRERLAAAQRNRDAASERLENFSTAAAERAVETAGWRVSRLRGLLRQGLVTQAELDSAQAAEDAAHRDLGAAREHASRLRQEMDTAGSHVRQAELEGGAQNSSVPLAESDLEDARATFATASERAARLRVTAPAAGTVVDLPVRAGEWLSPGALVAQVADLSQLRISAPVTALIAQKVGAGERVRVRIPTEPPQRLNASVESVTLAPDPVQHAYLIRVVVPNPNQGAILVGLEAAIEVSHSKRL